MPDLNLQSEAVRGEIDKVTSFWLDRGVDGFRLDAVIYYNNNNQTETIDDLHMACEQCEEQKADAYMVGEGWTTYREYAKYYKSGIDSMFNLIFTAGWIYWKGVNVQQIMVPAHTAMLWLMWKMR